MKPSLRLLAKTSLMAVISFALFGAAAYAEETPIQTPVQTAAYVPDEIIVKFKEGANSFAIASTLGGDVQESASATNVETIQIPEGSTVTKELQKYNNHPNVEYAEPNYIGKVFGSSNDPSFSEQWSITKMKVDTAWDTTKGDPSIIIAVIDTGVDVDHPDLMSNLVSGYNTINNTANADDDHNHGTHVAGIAAGVVDNGTGISGIAGKSKIMPIKAMGSDGTGQMSDVIEGIYWAADNGAKIINMSLGFSAPSAPKSLQDAVDYAYGKGIVVVAAAGNDNVGTPRYPAALNHVIAVAATDSNDKKASFSNYGNHIDVAAPGVNILSTLKDGQYGMMNGTSMAAPNVSGVVALIMAYNPSMTPGQVESLLTSTSTDLGALKKDSIFGYGLVNAYAALNGKVATEAPAVSNIIVTNNGNADDSVSVSGLKAGDIVKVYARATGGEPLGTGTVAVGDTSVAISIPQLGKVKGSVYISVTSGAFNESIRVVKTYDAEPVSPSVDASKITVINNPEGTSDSVEVNGLMENDIIKVYASTSAIEPFAAGTVQTGQSSVTISTSLTKSAGTIYITRASQNKGDSARTAKTYIAEPASVPLASGNINIANNVEGISDTITVTGLVAGDVARIYTTANGKVPIGGGRVKSGETSAVISIPQIGKAAGTVYISVTSFPLIESTRTAAAYLAENISAAPSADDITVSNNIEGIADLIKVTGVASGDIVRIFPSEKSKVYTVSGKVPNGKTDITLSLPQLTRNAGTILVSVINAGKLESVRTPKPYNAEAQSTPPLAENITVTNNLEGLSDEILVKGLQTGDVVKVYAGTAKIPVGIATVPSNSTEVAVSVMQLGKKGGPVNITVTTPNMLESVRTVLAVPAELVSTAPAAGDISLINNGGGVSDLITVTGLAGGDLIKVYIAGNIPAGLATVAEGETSATAMVAQVGKSKSKIYVTVTSPDKSESVRTIKEVPDESISTAPASNNIVVANNKGTADTITVSGVNAGDVIRIYAKSTGDPVIGSFKVAEGETSASITVYQLGAKAGTIYISVTSPDKPESTRTAKPFAAEQ